ncbi:hypothetical protein FACS1894102_3410 [Spirochaetia bacterium]|nr:hypothetical protein FACS1894102_3410 [Spirochaetia bacterium]
MTTVLVEQKNGVVVRGAVGYYRFEGQAMRDALAAVYEAYCPLLNYFYPCSKLLAKERVGMKVKKTREVPKPPFQRLLQRSDVSDEVKQEP